MARRMLMLCCFVLPVVNNCGAESQGARNCSDAETALVASELDRWETDAETAMDYRKNDTLECLCAKRFCLSLCCPIGSLAVPPQMRNCSPVVEDASAREFPSLHDSRTLEVRSPLDIRDFHVLTWNPCREGSGDSFRLGPEVNSDDVYQLLENGSVYLPADEKTVDFTNYCLGAVDNSSVYRILLCDTDDDHHVGFSASVDPAFLAAMVISVPFLLVTFVVYSVVPELRTMHGATLRGYVGPLIVAYTTETILMTSANDGIGIAVCILLGFVIHSSYLASFFWLNVMCFDIWWTFGNFRSPPSNPMKLERKKFAIYSAYAWGGPSLISGVCAIMNFVPNTSGTYIGLAFGGIACWHYTETARPIYFDAPIGLTVVCNIGFFVSMAIKMMQHKKHTARHLKGTDSRRHDESKQRFNIYFKLFILMGVSWSIEVIGRLCNSKHPELWAITNFINTLQSIIIFVTFVWKDNVYRLLLERLGCRDRSVLSGSSLRSTHHSVASRTCSTIAAVPTGSATLEIN